MIKAKQLLKQGFIIVLAGTVLLTAACTSQKPAEKVTAQATNTAKQVQPKDTIEAAGKIKANDIKNIILDFSALIQAVHVKDGQRVSQGAELLTLDLQEIKQQILDQQNDLSIEKLQLAKNLNNNSDNTKNEMRELQIAQAELQRAQQDLATQQQLFQGGAVAQTDVEAAQRKVEDAEKKVAGKLLSKTNDFKLTIEIQRQKIKALETDLQQLKAKLQKSYLHENKVVSDLKNGLVKANLPVVGDSIPANTKLLSLVNMDSLVVEAEVSEDFIKDVKIGAEVTILPLSDSTKQYKGRVLKIADMGIEKNGETVVLTEISIDNKDQFIKPDFNVDVKISK